MASKERSRKRIIFGTSKFDQLVPLTIHGKCVSFQTINSFLDVLFGNPMTIAFLAN